MQIRVCKLCAITGTIVVVCNRIEKSRIPKEHCRIANVANRIYTTQQINLITKRGVCHNVFVGRGRRRGLLIFQN
jgi:hypothetical protein